MLYQQFSPLYYVNIREYIIFMKYRTPLLLRILIFFSPKNADIHFQMAEVKAKLAQYRANKSRSHLGATSKNVCDSTDRYSIDQYVSKETTCFEYYVLNVCYGR